MTEREALKKIAEMYEEKIVIDGAWVIGRGNIDTHVEVWRGDLRKAAAIAREALGLPIMPQRVLR